MSIRYPAKFLLQVGKKDETIVLIERSTFHADIIRTSSGINSIDTEILDSTLVVRNKYQNITYSEEHIHHDFEGIQVSYTDTLCTTWGRD